MEEKEEEEMVEGEVVLESGQGGGLTWLPPSQGESPIPRSSVPDF